MFRANGEPPRESGSFFVCSRLRRGSSITEQRRGADVGGHFRTSRPVSGRSFVFTASVRHEGISSGMVGTQEGWVGTWGVDQGLNKRAPRLRFASLHLP